MIQLIVVKLQSKNRSGNQECTIQRHWRHWVHRIDCRQKINGRENRSGNQECTIQRHWRHWVHRIDCRQKINGRENRSGNQECTIQRHWRHWVHRIDCRQKINGRENRSGNQECTIQRHWMKTMCTKISFPISHGYSIKASCAQNQISTFFYFKSLGVVCWGIDVDVGKHM